MILGKILPAGGSNIATLKNDLVFCFEMDSQTSGVITDSHNAYPIYLIGDCAIQSGKIGNCVYMDGGGDALWRDDNILAVTDRTISIWFKTYTANYNWNWAVFSKRHIVYGWMPEQEMFLIVGQRYFSPYDIEFGFKGISSAFSGSVYPGNWYNVIMSQRGSDGYCWAWLNGVCKVNGGGGWTGAMEDSTQEFYIGRYDFYQSLPNFWGWIDQTAFWSRILTPAERSAIYNNGNGYPYSKW